MKKYIWGIFYGILLTSFTVFVLLDTFVITRVYTAVPNSDNSNSRTTSGYDSGEKDDAVSDNTSISEPQSTVITANSYKDDNISITITEYRENDTTIYVADVQLSSAEYLKTALAYGAYGKNVTEKTSEIAKENNAILAINGDYYGSQEKGYVLRNGVLYRDVASSSQEDLVIYQNGSFEIITEENVSADSLLSGGAQQILSFGPALVVNGERYL